VVVFDDVPCLVQSLSKSDSQVSSGLAVSMKSVSLAKE